MIKRLIKKLRRQPKHTRDKVAMGIAGSFTAAIFVVWLYHMPDRISAITAERERDDAPAFSQLFDQIGDQLSSAKNAVSEDEEPETSEDRSDFVESLENWTVSGSSTASSSDTTASSSATYTMTASSTPRSVNAGVVKQATTSEPRAIRLVTDSQATSSVGAE